MKVIDARIEQVQKEYNEELAKLESKHEADHEALTEKFERDSEVIIGTHVEKIIGKIL